MSSFEHIVSRNLQCAICLDPLTDPKLLSCSHTFCKQCLLKLSSLHITSSESESKPVLTGHPTLKRVPNAITCPVCRSSTDVKNGEVSSLPTNQSLKSIVLDVRDSGQACDICDSQPPAEQFCCDCGKNMCKTCHDTHNSWKPNLEHRVVSVEDIRQGNVVLERKVYCKDHRPGDGGHVCTDVCLTCKKFICMRCRIFNHEKVGHTAENTTDYEELFAKEVESLQQEAESKISVIKEHIQIVEKERQNSTNHISEVKQAIQQVHRETIEKMEGKKATLISDCDNERTKFDEEFGQKRNHSQKLIARSTGAKTLAGKISSKPLYDGSILIRDSLRNDLKIVLSVENPKESEPNNTSARAKRLEFEQDKMIHKLELGKVQFKS